MFAGIDNYFILENMFGKADVFAGAELNMLNIFWKDDIVRLEIKTFQKASFITYCLIKFISEKLSTKQTFMLDYISQ